MAGNHRVVALNIGTSNIVAIQGLVDDAPQGKRRAVVEKIATMKTPAAAVRSNGIHDPVALVEAVKRLWRENGLQSKNVIVGVNSRRVQSGVKWVPYMHPEDLAKVIGPEWVNRQAILSTPSDAANSTIHHFVLRERTIADASTNTQIRQILLLVVEVPKAEAQALANVIEDAGLELVGMDLVNLALLRAARLNRKEDKRVVDMLVDIGDTYMTMVLHNSGNIRATATVFGPAGESVTRAIADELRRLGKDAGASTANAAEIKHNLGRMVASDPENPITRRAVAAATQQSNTVKEEIRDFIVRYLDRVNENEGAVGKLTNREERGMQSITLTGGGSYLHGLMERLGSKEDDGGMGVMVSRAGVSSAYTYADHPDTPVPVDMDGVSLVSTIGLLTADRKAV